MAERPTKYTETRIDEVLKLTTAFWQQAPNRRCTAVADQRKHDPGKSKKELHQKLKLLDDAHLQ